MPDKPRPDTPLPFRLRAALAAPAGWPPDVLPNQIITAAHINSIRSSAYAWPGDVDGQNHTLRNVNLVNATGVLADPTTTAGDLIARGAATLGRFPIGAAGQVLTVDLALPGKLKWATPATAPVLSVFGRVGAVVAQAGDYTAAMVTGALADPLTTKGDLIARGAATGRMPVGLDGQVLRVDSAQTFGLRWSGESVPSVFGRTGPIVSQAGDYTAAQVSNAVSSLGSYPDPAWLPSISWAKLIGTPASFPPSAHTHDAAAIVSGVMATARLGTGVADATVYLRGDGTWAAAGTGGGGGVVSVFGRAGNVVATAGDYTAAMVTGAVSDPTSIRGDLIVRNDLNALVRLPLGANGQVLQADNTLTTGMKWTTITAAVLTPWVTDVDAANFQLFNVRRLGVAVALPAYQVDVNGDINYTGTLRKNGVPVTFGGSQTPWTSDIDGAGFTLKSAGKIGIGTAAPGALLDIVGANPLRLRQTLTGPALVSVIDAASNNLQWFKDSTPTFAASIGISSPSSGLTNGNVIVATFTGSAWADRVTITNAGNVGIGTAIPAGPVHSHVQGVGGGAPAGGLVMSRLWDGTNIRGGAIFNYFDTTSNSDSIAISVKDTTGNPWAIDSGIKFVVNAMGGCGIGTTNPAGSMLNVQAPINSGPINVIRWGTAANIYGLLTTDPTNYFSGAVALYKNGAMNTLITGNGPSYLMGGAVGIAMVPTSAEPLSINVIAFAANQNGGIRIQSAGGEWITRLALKSNGSSVSRFCIEVPNSNAGGVQEFFSIDQNTGYIGHLRLPTTAPGAGGGYLWVDASGFVKFVA